MDVQVKQYIDSQQPPQKKVVMRLRTLIKQSAPQALEVMSYGVPAFKVNGRLLVAYAAFKNHLGLYPEPETITVFKKELQNYTTSKGAIQFTFAQPIPYDLIEKILKFKYTKLADASLK